MYNVNLLNSMTSCSFIFTDAAVASSPKYAITLDDSKTIQQESFDIFIYSIENTIL